MSNLIIHLNNAERNTWYVYTITHGLLPATHVCGTSNDICVPLVCEHRQLLVNCIDIRNTILYYLYVVADFRGLIPICSEESYEEIMDVIFNLMEEETNQI